MVLLAWCRNYDGDTIPIVRTINRIQSSRRRILCRGIIFSKEKVRDSIHEEMFNQYFESEGFKVIGYRDVPVDTALLLNMLQILCLIFNKYLLTSQCKRS